MAQMSLDSQRFSFPAIHGKCCPVMLEENKLIQNQEHLGQISY